MPITPDIPLAETAIIEQTNAFRATARLGSVRSEPVLARAARDYANFLSAATLFSHEADGRRPIDRIKAAGYEPCAVAENLAWHSDPRGFETLELATRNVEGWKGSPGHRKNLLMEHATQVGVAIAKARREEKYFAVQLFGRPASLQFSFEIHNRAGRSVAYAVDREGAAVEPMTVVRHTVCAPAEVTFQLRPGSLLARNPTARYAIKSGAVFRLTAKGSDVVVELASQ